VRLDSLRQKGIADLEMYKCNAYRGYQNEETHLCAIVILEKWETEDMYIVPK
jgi:hypothetical protein